MQIRLTDINGQPMRGTAVLTYQGFDISISTIPAIPEMRVFGGTRHPGRDMTESIMGSDLSMYPTLKDLAYIKGQIDHYIGNA